uniref:Putative secreted protein n=1 Tax=Ixodes ricinus TaxID=34613 RepID=A0A6B0UPJ5_IXORI
MIYIILIFILHPASYQNMRDCTLSLYTLSLHVYLNPVEPLPAPPNKFKTPEFYLLDTQAHQQQDSVLHIYQVPAVRTDKLHTTSSQALTCFLAAFLESFFGVCGFLGSAPVWLPGAVAPSL